MLRFVFVSTALLLSALTVPTHAQAPLAMTVYKSPTCGCCAKWVEHIKKAGFAVTVKDMPNVGEVKYARGVPAELASCHTAVVGNYVIEGHVPADVVQKLLKEKPAVAGHRRRRHANGLARHGRQLRRPVRRRRVRQERKSARLRVALNPPRRCVSCSCWPRRWRPATLSF